MKRRITALFLALALLCAILPTALFSASAASSGTCGENLTWSYNGATKTLTISGSGEMDGWSSSPSVPWYSYHSAIKSVSLPNGLTSIGDWAFEGCFSLTSVTIGNSVTSIGDWAFGFCSSLTSVTIGNSVTSIGGYAFSDCSSLTSVTIGNSVTSIGEGAFLDCTGLTSVTIPDSVTSIGDYAFDGCSSLTSVTIPDSVTSIGDYAFSYCSSLTSVTVAEENPNYSSDAYGVLFNKNKTELICCPGGYSGSYTIPDSVTSIGGYAFSGCSSLTSVTIGNSVTSIGRSAFSYCNSLTSVTIPDSVTSIGDWAFYYCSSLTSVTIPDSVTSIGDGAFCACSSLTSVYFCGDAPELGVRVFMLWDELKEGNIAIPGLTLYFIEGKTGWTTPTWNGYPTATWKPESEDKPTTTFTDVKTSDWYYSAVNFAVTNNLFNGMGDNKFEPDTAMNRAMLVTVLWRYEGSPKGYTNNFRDVVNGEWYADAVSWAAANGIVNGIEGGLFDPEGIVTREQMAAILYRYSEWRGFSTGKRADFSAFPDSGKVSDWAKAAMQWAVAENLIGGSQEGGKTYILPADGATRAQVATILMRYVKNIAEAK